MKNGSQDLRAKSSALWRRQEKGRESVTKAVTKKGSEDLSEYKYRLGGYIRLSPSFEIREEGSLVSHPQRIEQFVEMKNLQHGGQWGKIIDWYTDKDLSGKDLNRPEFQRLCRDLIEGKINAVIVTELSRISRSVRDFCDLNEFFKSQGAGIISLKENFDTSTPTGQMLVTQIMSINQFERETTIERIKNGAKARADRGLAAGCSPLGYDPIPGKPNHRQVNQTEAAFVEMMFRKFLELKKVRNLQAYLNENGYRTKQYTTKSGEVRGGQVWTHSSLHNTLTNRAYIGQREVNKRNRGVKAEALPESERYYFTDAQWPKLVSEELFSEVQELLEENRKKARRYVHKFRLTGLIYCGECGAKLVGKSAHGRGGKYPYYGHMRKMTTKDNRHLERCKIENISSPEIEEAVVEYLKTLSRDHDLLVKLTTESKEIGQKNIEHQQFLFAAKEQERRKLAQKVDNLVACIAETTDGDSRRVLLGKISELKRQQDQVELEYAGLKQDLHGTRNKVIDVKAAMNILKWFRKGFSERPVAEQTAILKEVVRQIVVREEQTTVQVFGSPSNRTLTPPPEPGRGPNSFLKEISEDLGLGTNRSPVRTVSKVFFPAHRLQIIPGTSFTVDTTITDYCPGVSQTGHRWEKIFYSLRQSIPACRS